MNDSRQWADAYLAQAREDLRAAGRLANCLDGQGHSVLCMLLQMVFEKAAKAALLRSNQLAVRKAVRSHKAASSLVHILKRHRPYLEKIGHGDAHEWNDVLPMVKELERVGPQLAGDGPKLEYPWKDPGDGSIRCPERDLGIVQRLKDPKDTSGPRLLKFARHLCDQVDKLF